MSENRTFRKAPDRDGSARFYAPYHDDFVTELKKFVPENARKWHGYFWVIAKEYVIVTEILCRRFFAEETTPPPRPNRPPVYGDPDFTTFRAESIYRDAEEAMREQMRRRQYEQPFTYYDTTNPPSWTADGSQFFTEDEALRRRAEAEERRKQEEERRKREEQARQQEGSSQRPPPSGNFNDWFRQQGQYQWNDRTQPPPVANGRMTRTLAFSTLQVAANACPEVIEAAYKALAKKHHPDRPGGSTETMKSINEAYQMIKK